MKKQSKTESSEKSNVDLNVGDLLMDYGADGQGGFTYDLVIGYVHSKNYDDNYKLFSYTVDWSDVGQEEHLSDNQNLLTWRKRYIDFEKTNSL